MPLPRRLQRELRERLAAAAGCRPIASAGQRSRSASRASRLLVLAYRYHPCRLCWSIGDVGQVGCPAEEGKVDVQGSRVLRNDEKIERLDRAPETCRLHHLDAPPHRALTRKAQAAACHGASTAVTMSNGARNQPPKLGPRQGGELQMCRHTVLARSLRALRSHSASQLDAARGTVADIRQHMTDER